MAENISDSEFLQIIHDLHIMPDIVEWATIPIFFVLLIVGLTGNFLVIFVVLVNESMRTVTNIFLLNLALADFMVLLFCLPATVLWDVTRTWWFGGPICKIVLFVQNVSITVSVLTLVCISVERWYAICNPFKFKSTMSRTVRLLVIVWAIGLCVAIPESMTVHEEPYNFSAFNRSHLNGKQKYFTQCRDRWGPMIQQYYNLLQILVLFLIPLSIIGVMLDHAKIFGTEGFLEGVWKGFFAFSGMDKWPTICG